MEKEFDKIHYIKNCLQSQCSLKITPGIGLDGYVEVKIGCSEPIEALHHHLLPQGCGEGETQALRVMKDCLAA